ncbi:MAG: hypothetical protein II903_06865 [Spirochaetales bacterium]|nr:hypothetical protein [Spirochaetales bacterium]
MKRLCLILVFSLFLCASMTAAFRPVADLSPYFTFDNTPSGIAEGSLDWRKASGLQNESWWETRQDYWLDAFSRASFLNMGFIVDTDAMDMVVLVDVIQDVFVSIRDRGSLYTNIPFVNGGNLDLTFPRVGYVDYTSLSGDIYLSLGRRKIKWGPGTYGMAISDSQPYLDNLYTRFGTDISDSWRFGYDFTALAFKHFLDIGVEANGAPQTTFAHRFSFENSVFRASFAEMNNIYGKVPSLLDCTPIALWHNNFQDDCSNVMIDLSLEGRIGPVRLFGSFAMDDLKLADEPNTNPSAIGASGGVEWNVISGEAFEGRDFSNDAYAIKDRTFHVPGGLNVSYEFYYCSTYMYNRSVDAGKFTSDFQVNSNAGPKKFYDDNAFFLGFRFGPGSVVHLLKASYETEKLRSDLSVQLLRRGSYYIDSPYDDEAKAEFDPFGLPGTVTDVLCVSSSVRYYLQPGLGLDASFSFSYDMTHSASAVKAYAGVCMALCDVDWRNLF